MNKPVDIGPVAGQDEAALAQLIDHGTGDGLASVGRKGIALLQVRFKDGQQLGAVDEVARRPRGGLLHLGRQPA